MTATGTSPNGFDYWAPMMQSWQEAMTRAGAWPKVMQAAQRVRVGATPTRTVYREDNLRLLQYESDIEQRFRTPMIVVFALVNRPYILDLRPGKSVVQHFLNRGFDVYNIDWGIPADGDSDLGLKDYVLRYLEHVVDDVCKQTGVDQVNVLGLLHGRQPQCHVHGPATRQGPQPHDAGGSGGLVLTRQSLERVDG